MWQCKGDVPDFGEFNYNANFFYSPLTSSAQRLPNGNTLICEGTSAIIREFTKENKLVWEYVAPTEDPFLYRAYRIPYEWIPQIPAPEQTEIPRKDVSEYHIGDVDANDFATGEFIVEGAHAFDTEMAACVTNLD